jgi:hypothetical protein
MRSETFSRLMAWLGAAATALLIAMRITGKLPPTWEQRSLEGLMGLFVAFFSLALLTTIDRHPRSISISLLGFPYSGKTVYLTVLFDLLQTGTDRQIRFAPYGQETVERITDDLNTLSRGKWLPSTKLGSVFYYRAYATLRSSPLPRRFKIEIADYAGENMGELDPTSDMWLHKSQYFKYVAESDAILLAIDCELFRSGQIHKIDEAQNAFVAALQILAENKGVTGGLKLNTPVGILLLKADLLSGITAAIESDEFLSDQMPRLTAVWRERCKNRKSFFVSSVGALSLFNVPPTSLKPANVVGPIVWVLRNVRR